MTTEHTDTTYPDQLERKTSIGSTITLTSTSVTTFALGLIALPYTASGVNNSRLLRDETILLHVGVQSDFALSAFEDRSGEALLKLWDTTEG